MSTDISPELRAFLTEEARIAKIATNRKAGGPWVAPLWFTLDGNDVILVITAASILGRTLVRDPRIAICVDKIEWPYGFATLEGKATISDNAEESRDWTRKLALKYRPEIEDIEAYLDEMTAAYPGVTCRVKIDRAYFEPRSS